MTRVDDPEGNAVRLPPPTTTNPVHNICQNTRLEPALQHAAVARLCAASGDPASPRDRIPVS